MISNQYKMLALIMRKSVVWKNLPVGSLTNNTSTDLSYFTLLETKLPETESNKCLKICEVTK